MPELENKLAAPEGCTPLGCSALDAALALVDFGAHCIGAEDVNLAAARIIADEYRHVMAILKDPVAVHLNMLRGTIAWTPGHLRHVIGDSQENAIAMAPPSQRLPSTKDVPGG